MVGARIPAGTDGVDLSPVIEGRALAERPDLYWAYGKEGAAKETPQPALERDQAPPFAIREGDWKLLAEAGGASPQLFNLRSEEHTSELQSLMRTSYAVFCLNKKTKPPRHTTKS